MRSTVWSGHRAVAFWCVAILGVTACSGDEGAIIDVLTGSDDEDGQAVTVSEAGSPTDADSGTKADLGTTVDAGPPEGVDAAGAVDAFARFDSAPADDVGVRLDATADASPCSPHAPDDRTCDGVDDDCDGRIDEDITCTRCAAGTDGPPCNGCPEGTLIPDGWVCVPRGQFWMGSPEGEDGRQGYEVEHLVELTRNFLMKETEVTNHEWNEVADELGLEPLSSDSPHPASPITWFSAARYCNGLSAAAGIGPADHCYTFDECGDESGARAGRSLDCAVVVARGPDCPGFRLPSEAEWERAVRGGSRGAVYGLADEGEWMILAPDPLRCAPALDAIAWYACSDDEGGTVRRQDSRPVARKLSNPYGLYDMLGNAFEWVQDWHCDNYEGFGVPDEPIRDPAGPPAGCGESPSRVLRGGRAYAEAPAVRNAFRGSSAPGRRSLDQGVRPVRTLPP